MILLFSCTHLSRGGDAFPEREVADQIDSQQIQSVVPFYHAKMLQTDAVFEMVQLVPVQNVQSSQLSKYNIVENSNLKSSLIIRIFTNAVFTRDFVDD